MLKIDCRRSIENIGTTYSWKVCRGIVRADRSCAHVIQGSCGSRIPDSSAVPQDETDYCFATFMYPPRYICPLAPRQRHINAKGLCDGPEYVPQILRAIYARARTYIYVRLSSTGYIQPITLRISSSSKTSLLTPRVIYPRNWIE